MSTAHWQGNRLPIPAVWPVRSSPTIHQWAIISAGAWRGTRRSADGTQQRWALAIGHAYTPDGPLTVTFTRRAHRATIHPITVGGLWVAAATGHKTAACRHTPAAASALQLMPVTTRPPPR
jgi:hypothetical protein